jgi:hypothetical protein
MNINGILIEKHVEIIAALTIIAKFIFLQ